LLLGEQARLGGSLLKNAPYPRLSVRAPAGKKIFLLPLGEQARLGGSLLNLI
jgi:hypothetical protein